MKTLPRNDNDGRKVVVGIEIMKPNNLEKLVFSVLVSGPEKWICLGFSL